MAFQVQEHEMIGGGFERHRALGWNWQSVGQLTHFHHAIRHAHLVNLSATRNVRSHRDEPIGRRRAVLDGEIAGSNFRASWRCPRPRRLDGD
jgi:hypothetical protein